MSFVFLQNVEGLSEMRASIFTKQVREYGGLVYGAFRKDSTTHIIVGKRKSFQKLSESLERHLEVDRRTARTVSVLCCDFLSACLQHRPPRLESERNFTADLSGFLRADAWRQRVEQHSGGSQTTILNALVAAAPVRVLEGGQSLIPAPRETMGLSDPIAVRVRRGELGTGAAQSFEDIRPSSRYSSLARLETDTSAPEDAADRSASESLPSITHELRQPAGSPQSSVALRFAELSVSWDDRGTTVSATLSGPMLAIQNYWLLCKRWQENYWAVPKQRRSVEQDMPYPLVCFSRGRPDAYLNFEHDSMMGPGSAYGESAKPAVIIAIDPAEYEKYHGCWPGHLFFRVPESKRGIGFSRHSFKQFATGGECGGHKLALPFYTEIDDLVYNIKEIERDEATGEKKFVSAAAGGVRKPSLLCALLSLQRLPDVQDYGLLGVVRDRGPVLGTSLDYMVNTLSIYKFRMVNVDLTRDVDYVPQLVKFEDIAFNYQLLHKKRPRIPTFKSYLFAYRASLRTKGGAAAGRDKKAICDPSEFLEANTALGSLRPHDQEIVNDLLAWVRKAEAEDERKANARLHAAMEETALNAHLGASGAAAAAGRRGQMPGADDDDDDDGDDDDGNLASVLSDFAGLQQDCVAELYPHQTAALRWLAGVERNAVLKGGILADEMGLGKTITLFSLIAGNTPRRSGRGGGGSLRRPTLIVVPLSLMVQWVSEFRRHTKHIRVTKYYGSSRHETCTAESLSAHEVVITTYDTLVADEALSAGDYDYEPVIHGIQWHRVICDEAAFVKNFQTERATMVARLCARFCWLVTGSPIQNQVQELKNLLKVCGYGGLVDANWRPLCRHVLLRRTLRSVIASAQNKGKLTMPTLTTNQVLLKFGTDRERSVYQRLEQQSAAVGAGQGYHVMLSTLMKLRQACLHSSLATRDAETEGVEAEDVASALSADGGGGGGGAGGGEGGERARQARRELEGAGLGTKIQTLLAELAALRAQDAAAAGSRSSSAAPARPHKVLVFSFFKSFLDLISAALESRGIGHARLHGSMPAAARGAAVERFKRRPAPGGGRGCDVFLISIKAGGLGLNLTEADRVLIGAPQAGGSRVFLNPR
jgi:hypothetical protein